MQDTPKLPEKTLRKGRWSKKAKGQPHQDQYLADISDESSPSPPKTLPNAAPVAPISKAILKALHKVSHLHNTAYQLGEKFWVMSTRLTHQGMSQGMEASHFYLGRAWVFKRIQVEAIGPRHLGTSKIYLGIC